MKSSHPHRHKNESCLDLVRVIVYTRFPHPTKSTPCSSPHKPSKNHQKPAFFSLHWYRNNIPTPSARSFSTSTHQHTSNRHTLARVSRPNEHICTKFPLAPSHIKSHPIIKPHTSPSPPLCVSCFFL